MRLPDWMKTVLWALAGVAVGILLVILKVFKAPSGPTKADKIITGADAEKAKIRADIKADNDQALVDRFNKLGEKT
jgi:hypothetical protein